MREVAYSASNEQYRLDVMYDETAESPRGWGNLGKMICFHGRYDLGMSMITVTPKTFS